MYDITDANFLPQNFIVQTFYGEKTCFCWNKNKLVVFPYMSSNDGSVEVLTVPASIKTIQCFAGRIFLICIPRGIYKLSRDRKFAVLSKNAIGMGTVFYEVLTSRNGYLYLDNKQTMINKILFQLSCTNIDSSMLCVYSLNADNVAEHFMKALMHNGDPSTKDICIIGEELKLLTLINETAQIIYNSIYSIRDIIPVHKDSKIAGLFLLTSTNVVVIMYSKDNTLVFERIYLKTNIQTICAGFSQLSEDTLWIVYICESKLYYVKKQLLTDNIEQIKVQDKNFISLQSYDSKVILALTENKELIEFSTDIVEKTFSLENDAFINLHPDMLKGAELIMDQIYKGSQELGSLNQILTVEEDKLKRINLYAHKFKVKLRPKIMLNRLANQLFLSANFHNMLPKNSWVVLNIKLENQNLFYTKKIVDEETMVDIHIPENLALNISQIITDVVVFKDEEHPWCLIRDYTIDSNCEQNKKKMTRSNYNFIHSKIVVLQTLMQEKNINLKKLSEIKRSVRKKFKDI